MAIIWQSTVVFELECTAKRCATMSLQHLTGASFAHVSSPCSCGVCAQLTYPDFGGLLSNAIIYGFWDTEMYIYGPFWWFPPHILISCAPDIPPEGSHVKLRSAQISGVLTVP